MMKLFNWQWFFPLHLYQPNVAAAVVGVTALVGAAAAADSSRSAANKQADAANQSNDTQRYMYDQTRADNAPFLKNGTAASNALAGGLGIGPATAGGPASGSLTAKFTQNDLNNDVVYNTGLQFGLDQGVQGINRQASAGGALDSGAVLKALTRFGTDYGNTKAGDAYNRFTTNQDSTYNKLAGVAGSGQVASSQVGSAGQNMANQISQNQIGVGNARGASAIAQGNALSGGLTSGYNSYQQNRLINGYLGNSNPYGSNGGSGYVGSNDYYANNDYLTS